MVTEDFKDSKVIKENAMTITVKEGEKTEISNEGFKEVAEKMLKTVEEIAASIE
ncbi:MAG: hypothetical protein K6E95_05750 [Lachnospiraceae bacterium]|nr:hypothetical protein [Lachnospiraceae bacterium]